jgi:hypothetical protein
MSNTLHFLHLGDVLVLILYDTLIPRIILSKKLGVARVELAEPIRLRLIRPALSPLSYTPIKVFLQWKNPGSVLVLAGTSPQKQGNKNPLEEANKSLRRGSNPDDVGRHSLRKTRFLPHFWSPGLLPGSW